MLSKKARNIVLLGAIAALLVAIGYWNVSPESFLDKPVVVDESKAADILQQVDTGPGKSGDSNDDAIKSMQSGGSTAPAKEEDPMAAFKDLPKDGDKK